MKEKWADIKGYEGLYQISSYGRVKSLNKKGGNGKNQKEQLMRLSKRKYLTISLCKNSKYETFNVHRLVAEAFIPNPQNLKYVNHIDYDKYNNKVDNLEWCTARENSLWSLENMRKALLKKQKPLSGHHYIQKRSENSFRFQYNKNGKSLIRKKFNSLEDAIKFRDEWFKENEPQINCEVI